MTYSVTYNPTDKIIEAQVHGDLTLQVAKEVSSEIAKISKEKNCFVILNDLREATIKLSTLEIYDLPKTFSEIATAYGLEIYKIKRAFVTPKGSKDWNFYETVTVNRAQTARYFFDINEARNWLLKK